MQRESEAVALSRVARKTRSIMQYPRLGEMDHVESAQGLLFTG